MDKLYRPFRLLAARRKPTGDSDGQQATGGQFAKSPMARQDSLQLQNGHSRERGAASDCGQKLPLEAVAHPESDGQQAARALGAGQNSAGFQDCLTPMTRSRLNTLAQIGEDWLYLALLGIIMALLSLSMDSMISLFLGTRIWLSDEMREQNLLLQYLAWCIVPILLVTFSTGFVHLCSPTAIGSGIPEMKTILRGVVLNEYLTFRTLVAKIVGLTFTLGSGLPLGKEGPSVHMASIVATLLSKLVASFQGIYENESRTSEMLSAACAVGVAATFYAPIGGVLFSIEVTTVYFAVRNYWRGFFAACCGATIWRLLGFYIQNDESISAIFKTNFATDYPFDPIELLVFSFIGATCGLAGAAYIKFHREIVQFFRRHKRISGFLQQNRFVYPILVTLIITTSTFPPLLGQYTAATLSTHTTIEHLFSNRTWSLGAQDLVSKRILDAWTTEATDFHLHLVLHILMLFWTSALASTIPTPSGVFIPVVKMGAAYGRLIGELMAWAYPAGIKYSQGSASIVPGSYAVVGAAALSGAVTHTVSTSVILFEMTGQIVHIIPVILGVLISNAVCQSLQPSIYDSIIEIKKLPYLPPIASSNSISHRILVKDFMNAKSIPFVWKVGCTYADLKALLSTHRKIISFPLVESPDSMKLLGSVARPDLLRLLYLHLGRERRLQEVCRRNSDTLTPAIHLLSTISGRMAAACHPPASPQTSHASYPQLARDPSGGQFAIEGPQGADEMMKKTSVDSSNSQNSLLDDRGLQFKSVGGAQPELVVEQLAQLPEGAAGCGRAPDQRQPRAVQSRPVARQNSTISDSIVGGRQASYQPTVSHTPDVDCDPTRLIISASRHCNKYGATSPTGSDEQPQQPEASPRFGEEQLLTDCQKHQNAYEEALKEFGGVAKMVNHYDRGSSMDAEHLDKSIQEVEGRLASAGQGPPEIVVVVAPKTPAAAQQQESCCSTSAPAAASRIPKLLEASTHEDTRLSPQAPSRHRQTCKLSSVQLMDSQPNQSCLPWTPSQQQPRSQGHANRQLSHSVSSSPSLSSRPTKSILKTSSFNNMAKRSITSSASFTNNHLHHAHYNHPSAQSMQPHHQHHLGNHQRQQPGHLAANFVHNSTSALDHCNQHSQQIQLQQPTAAPAPTAASQKSPSSNQLSGLKFTLADPPLANQAATSASDTSGDLAPEQLVRQRRKVRLPRLRVVDMAPEEQEQWEKEQLGAFIDINKCQIDEAPFQLVEQTSLYRVHTLFSMLGLNHAYVTSFGRLVGIVALKDIRYAIERMLQEKL